MPRFGRSFPSNPQTVRQLHQDNSRTATITDVQNLTDSQTTLKFLTAIITDSLGLTDSLSNFISKVITDALGLVDSKAVSFSKILADSVDLTDAVTLAHVKYKTDAISLQDSVSTVISTAWAVTITDSFGADAGGKMVILIDGEYLAVKVTPGLYIRLP